MQIRENCWAIRSQPRSNASVEAYMVVLVDFFTMLNTMQYNGKFALKNWQTHCQFNLAHKLKRTEMFKRKMK